MSIQTEITRLQGLRNTMRAAWVALGLAHGTGGVAKDSDLLSGGHGLRVAES